jgi:hypothetical protein
VVDAAKPSEQRPNCRLVGKINGMALGAFRQRLQRLVNSRPPARSDDHRGALARRRLGDGQPDPGTAAQHHNASSLEVHGCLLISMMR